MLRVAVPNKGSLSQAATEMLQEAGYRRRFDSKELTVLDRENDVEFFFLRPKDIAIYVAKGELDLGITGRDLVLDSGANVAEVLELGFGNSTFRYAAKPKDATMADGGWQISDLAGKRIATSYENIVEADLAAKGVEATVIHLDGAVEIAIQLGVADAIADVVSSGRTLRNHGLVAFGEVVVASQAVVITRNVDQLRPAAQQMVDRLRGVVFAQQYMMLDYDCPASSLEAATAITPGIESPTISPLANEGWVAVRAMVPRKGVNLTMDELRRTGAKAILASDIRTCRM